MFYMITDSYCEKDEPMGGSGQFFCPRVGFQVFRFGSGRVSGQARVKFFCIFQSILAVFGKKLAIFFKNPSNPKKIFFKKFC